MDPRKIAEDQLRLLEVRLRCCAYEVLSLRHQRQAYGSGITGRLRYWFARPLPGHAVNAQTSPAMFPHLVRRVYISARGGAAPTAVTTQVDGEATPAGTTQPEDADDFTTALPSMSILFATRTSEEADIVTDHATTWNADRDYYDKHWDLRMRDSTENMALTDHIRFLFEVRNKR